MSQADVDAINAHTDAALAQLLGGKRNVPDAVWNGATFGSQTAAGLLVQASSADDAKALTEKVIAATDTLEASEAAEAKLLAALAGLTPEAVAAAVVAELTKGGNGTSIDAAALEAAVGRVLDDKLPTTFVAQARDPQA